MGNNQNQIIKQALEILSENNRFALKSITNDSAIKTNFYKLSDVDIRPELREEIEKEHEPSDPRPVVPYEPEIDNSDLLKHKNDDPESDPDSDPKPERIDSNKYKRPKHTGLIGNLERITLELQAKAIFQLDFEYAAKERGLSKPEMKAMKQNQKDEFMRSLGLKTLDEIRKMDPEKRAKHMDLDFSDRPRVPSSRILNRNIGDNR
jgi:hypothetical protein